MPGRKGNKGPRGRSSGTGRVQTVTSLSASQTWDRRLANSKDRCRVVDRVYTGLIAAAAGSTNGSLLLAPLFNTAGAVGTGAFGLRVAAIANCFLRYRIHSLLACYRPLTGTTTAGRIGLGFFDDPSTATTQVTASVNIIDETRCSHVDSVYREIEVPWKPVDSTTWYFCDPAPTNSASDERLEVPALLAYAQDFGPGTTTNYGVVYVYYDIEFEGAVDSGGVV